jgi:hypothetical protein
LLCEGCRTTVGERPAEHLQFLPRGAHRAVTAADWRLSRLLGSLQKFWSLGFSAGGERR